MSKDCDIFSDTYGCVFTDCEGYQAPFPILRLGNPGIREGGAHELQAIANCRGVPPTHKLLSLALDGRSPCRSFVEILSSQTKPVLLQHCSGNSGGGGDLRGRFFQGPCRGQHLTAVASRNGGDRGTWSANLVAASEPARQCILPNIHAVAMVHDNRAWFLHGGTNTVTVADPVMLLESGLHGSTAAVTVVSAPPTGGTGHVVATSEHTAAVFHSRGVYGTDLRAHNGGGTWKMQLPHDAKFFPCGSCGVAAEHVLVCRTADGHLLLYDQRCTGAVSSGATATALLTSKSLGTPAGVRTCHGRGAVLLIASDQVGIFDTRTLTMVGALQQSSDGDVMDAILLPSDDSERSLRICTTALNGMLYCWHMSY